MDEQHCDAIINAVMDAIAEASRIEGLGAPVLRTGEIVDALITVTATVLALSPDAAGSPTKARHTADLVARRLQRRLTAFRGEAGQVAVQFVDVANIRPGSGSRH